VHGWAGHRAIVAGGEPDPAMALHLERIDWMPSPPLAPSCPIDLAHLRRMTLGDDALEREVLGMFAEQAGRLMVALTATPRQPGLAHTLKGSALGIGAFAVAEAAGWLETLQREDGDTGQALASLQFAVEAACESIAARLSES
jgi:HPt (histidine-containing phosphotransfer) domain-containing protein